MRLGGAQDVMDTSGSGGAQSSGVQRMPVENSPSAIQAARNRRRAILARSGRSSTKLAGTGSYKNSFLGDV